MEIRRAAERFHTEEPGIDAWHCFSYAKHYDPANTHFATLLAHNEFTLQPGAGFAAHRHSEIEVVTWLLDGALWHTDDAGHRAVLHPGQAQRMTAGSGVDHAETNEGEEPSRFVQMWLTPDEPGLAPSYAQHDFTADLATGNLVAVASGAPDRPVALRMSQPKATLHAARPKPGTQMDLPRAPYLHVYVAHGEFTLDGAPLAAGDEARISDAAAHAITATGAAEVLIWEMHGTA